MDLGYLIGGDTIINTATDYSNGGTMTGNLTIQDADSPTKAYRMRTSGSDLDFDFAGANGFFSVYPNADFTGTQKHKIRFGNGNYMSFVELVEFKRNNNHSDATQHSINSDGGVILNEQGLDADTRIEGDTDTNLLFVDASADKVGIGTASPATKLDVNGTVKGAFASSDGSTGISTTITSASLVGKTITIKDGLIVGFS